MTKKSRNAARKKSFVQNDENAEKGLQSAQECAILYTKINTGRK